MRQTLATYFVAYLVAQGPTQQADADRHAAALEAVITGLPAGYTAADRIRAIEGYLAAQVAQAPADAQRHAQALNAALPAVPVQQTQPPRNQTQPPRNQPTPPAPASASHLGWIIAAVVFAIIAAILAGIAAFRDTGSAAIAAKVDAASADLAQVKGAVIGLDADGRPAGVIDAVKFHQAWSEQKSVVKTDLESLAKESTLQGVATKVAHIEKVVVGSLTYTPKTGRDAGKEKIVSLRGLVSQADLNRWADRLSTKDDVNAASARTGTVVVTTDGAAEVLSGDDATAALAPPSP